MTGNGYGWTPPPGGPGGPGEPAASGPPAGVAWFPPGDRESVPAGVGFGQGAGNGGPPPPPLPPVPPRRGGLGGTRLVILMIAVAAVVVVVLIVVATTGGSPSPTGPTVAATGVSITAGGEFPSTTSTPTTASSTPDTPITATAPATSALPTVSAIGIDIAAIGGNPHAIPVTKMFDTYFAGVNAHDAAAATSVFAPGGSIDPSDPDQVASFGADIATTADSAIVIRSITSTPAGLDVLVTFTSTQAPDLGPDGQACTRWSIVYHLVAAGNGVGIIKASADHEGC